jgi:hypothetical protein
LSGLVDLLLRFLCFHGNTSFTSKCHPIHQSNWSHALVVRTTFNLLSLYQQAASPQAGYRQPGTLRTAVFVCGAILGSSGRQAVLHLSTAWGGLEKHKPLLDAVLSWQKTTPPKLDVPPPVPIPAEPTSPSPRAPT